MRFDIVTIFPEFFTGPLDYGIVRRAREARLIDVRIQDLREFTHDRHRTVDDRPFGGGEGMVLKPEPLFEAVESLLGQPARPASTAVVLLSASGKLFRQADARRLAALERVILLCGRYEGVDERVAEHLATEELSIGDFVLSGGELAAALVVDALTRLLPGALGNERFVAPRVLPRLRQAPNPARPAKNCPQCPSSKPAHPRRQAPGRFCSTSRITRGQRSSAAGPCRKYCSAATKKRFASGASAWPSKKRAAIAPTSSAPRLRPSEAGEAYVRFGA